MVKVLLLLSLLFADFRVEVENTLMIATSNNQGEINLGPFDPSDVPNMCNSTPNCSVQGNNIRVEIPLDFTITSDAGDVDVNFSFNNGLMALGQYKNILLPTSITGATNGTYNRNLRIDIPYAGQDASTQYSGELELNVIYNF